jgi:protein O-GlcNAc transferase
MANPAPANPGQAVATMLRDGVAHHQAGRLAEAESLYQRALALQPRQPDALNLIGLIQHQRGRTAAALARFEEALAIAPRMPEIHNNRGMALTRLGRADEAIAALREALALRRDYPEAQFNLGNALRMKGDKAAACEAYRAALGLRTDFHDAHLNLGNLLTESGDLEAGTRHLERALSLRPATAEALNNLAVALMRARRFDDAEARLNEALALRPDFVPAHVNLGRIAFEFDNRPAASASFAEALRLQPDNVDARLLQGRLLHKMGRFEEALEHLRAAVVGRPADAEVHFHLGRALEETLSYPGAIAAFRRAIEIEPDHGEAQVQLGNVLLASGRVKEAIALFEAAAAGRRAHAATENLLMSLIYSEEASAESIARAHRDAGRTLEAGVAPMPAVVGRDRDPERRLRIGYVSDDFRWHSCAFFVEPLLAAHDRSAVEVFCYSTTERVDSVTHRLRGYGHSWRDVPRVTDHILAGHIRADAIDILVDLGGHSSGNRLGVFAMKPAPIQVTWLGYPHSTGLSRMDYRFTDGRADPAGIADELHTESVVRLPHGFLCYRPPAEAPEISPLPAETAGVVTFGSFNNLSKIGRGAVALWASILWDVPGSRLLMKNKALGNEEVRVRYRKMFAEHGIVPERLGFFPLVRDLADMFEAYASADLSLDSFPYNGTTTTCDSLWMGVPVVTLEGDRHAGRVGSSLLGTVGLDELVATSTEDYRRRAVALAQDLPRLAELRRGLRARLAASPLRDEPGFARTIEQAYRDMWRRWSAAPA